MAWLSNSSLVSKDDSIVDLGCGNGMTLVKLAEAGFTKLTGLDYSAKALDLAEAVASARQITNIVYKTCDIVCEVLQGEYSIVLDKGTYDAISVHTEHTAFQRECYKTNLRRLVKKGGLFVISCCNWTEEEIKEDFKDFTTIDTIPAPKYTYGGKDGNTISTIIFKKKP